MKKLWVTWEDDSSIRSRVLASELGAKYLAFTFLSNSRWLRWLRYPIAMCRTAWSVLALRPDLVVAQNPSIVLAWQVAVLRRLGTFRLVVDLHTHFVRPTGLSRLIYESLNDYSLRHADAVIVTNDAYRGQIRSKTDSPVWVLPDKVPELSSGSPMSLEGRRQVMYICTFSMDEPWAEVIRAAERLPADTYVYVSGRSPLDQSQVPRNVVLTGYLPRADYEGLLNSVDAVMVLTTAEDNLVCGGYEAVAAEKPLVLSDTEALRELFSRGAIYTENRTPAIAEALERALTEGPRLAREITELKQQMAADWQGRWEAILNQLGPDGDHEATDR